MKHYGEQVIRIILGHIDASLETIIHIHTLNLIDIAINLKNHIARSAIITPLHCIPWKSWVNSSFSTFVQRYSLYLSNNSINPVHFQTNRSEIDSYTKADRIVCLTECAQAFVSKMCANRHFETILIPNGLSDLSAGSIRSFDTSEPLKLVFVGSFSRGKGFLCVLDAMRMAQDRGIVMQLEVAGRSSADVLKQITESYSDLNINIHGTLARADVVDLYRSADIGLIASLQEQCSYVAIEMAKMSLPIITTAIDGLDEMFTDGVNALKVPVSFSRTGGLAPDIVYMADCIARLARDKRLRKTLGLGARDLYLKKYTLDRMGSETVDLYQNIFESL